MHITLYISYKYKIRSTTNNSIPEIAEKMLQMIEKNRAPDLHSRCEKIKYLIIRITVKYRLNITEVYVEFITDMHVQCT